MSPVSLTSLTLVPDETLALNEVRMHPDLIDRVRRAFHEADLLRSVHLSTRVRTVIHPYTSVGDEDDAA
jgi:hypothetical protein